MKFIRLLLLLSIPITGVQADIISSSSSDRTIVIPGDSYQLDFQIYWYCNDYPIANTAGRVELLNAQNQLVGWAEANATNSGATTQSSLGSVHVSTSSISVLAADLTAGDGSLSARWEITGIPSGTYTLRFWNFETQSNGLPNSTVWTQTLFQYGYAPPPANRPPSVVLHSPGNQTITAGTTLSLNSVATDADGNLTQHNLDIQRPSGDWNFSGNFATGEPFQGGPIGSGAHSTRNANFTFSDLGTYHIRSAASDGHGWSHSGTVAVTVTAPPPTLYPLTTTTNGGGTVTPGGTYHEGTTVVLSANPDSLHRFVGWTGDVGGSQPSATITMDSPKWVQAVFANKDIQSISFESLADQTVGTSLPLTASASSNLPVQITLMDGPASLNGSVLTITGVGTITLQASQPGNGLYLAAVPITQTFDAIPVIEPPARLKYHAEARTLIETESTQSGLPYLIQP